MRQLQEHAAVGIGERACVGLGDLVGGHELQLLGLVAVEIVHGEGLLFAHGEGDGHKGAAVFSGLGENELAAGRHGQIHHQSAVLLAGHGGGIGLLVGGSGCLAGGDLYVDVLVAGLLDEILGGGDVEGHLDAVALVRTNHQITIRQHVGGTHGGGDSGGAGGVGDGLHGQEAIVAVVLLADGVLTLGNGEGIALGDILLGVDGEGAAGDGELAAGLHIQRAEEGAALNDDLAAIVHMESGLRRGGAHLAVALDGELAAVQNVNGVGAAVLAAAHDLAAVQVEHDVAGVALEDHKGSVGVAQERDQRARLEAHADGGLKILEALVAYLCNGGAAA